MFPEIKSALKGLRIQDTEGTRKCDDCTGSYYTTGILKLFPTVATSLGYMYIAAKGEYFEGDPSQ
jgi:hypothetical protein